MTDFTGWRLKRGDDWSATLRFYTDETKTARQNLTDYSAVMEIRESFGTPVLLTLSTANNKISISGAAGEVTLTLTHHDTDAAWNTALADLKLIDGDGHVKHHMLYPFSIDAVVTA